MLAAINCRVRPRARTRSSSGCRHRVAFWCRHLEISATNEANRPSDTSVPFGREESTRHQPSGASMPLSSPRLRRFTKQALVAVVPDPAPDQAQLATAFELLCDRLRARLHPLFGGAAIAALFARALHVATTEFPWLADVVPKNGERCSLENLERVSGAVERESLQEGLAAVLAHEIGLLSAFIGEDFVMPLVQAAWETTSSGPARIEGDHE